MCESILESTTGSLLHVYCINWNIKLVIRHFHRAYVLFWTNEEIRGFPYSSEMSRLLSNTGKVDAKEPQKIQP